MVGLSRILFFVLLIIAAIFIVATTGQLPPQVASHFGLNGAPNGWMSRDGYRTFMLVFAIVLPLVVVLSAGILPRAMDSQVKIPNREYWLDPKRREETMRYLGSHAYWLGSLIVVFLAALHGTLLEANSTQPPHLPGALFGILLGAFLVGLVLWIAALSIHFRRRA